MIQISALVNEACVKLVNRSRVRGHDRVHFFAVSARLMRRIVFDLARSARYQKRGGRAERVPLTHNREIAAALDVSPRAVRRDWGLPRVWLRREIEGGRP